MNQTVNKHSETTAEPPVALVTGGGTGIGAACAEAFAKQGIRVAVNFNSSADSAQNVVAVCEKYGVDALAVQGNVSDDADCRDIMSCIEGRWGRLDMLINNAGVTRFAEASDLDALSDKDFQEIFAVNVTGAYQMIRAASSLLNRSTNASVVNISSHSGFSGIGSSTAYAASKGALNTLTRAMALAMAPRVRVNAVCPGFVDTGWMAKKLDEESLTHFKDKVAKIAPLKQVVTPDQVAEAVLWFALGGKTITGQLLVIDGGTHLTVGNPI